MTSAHASNITPLPQQPQSAPMADEITESALLGTLLLGTSPAEFQRFVHLTEDHFYGDRHKRLWSIMKTVSAEGFTINLTNVKARFKALTAEGEAFLMGLLSQSGESPIDYARALTLIEWRRDVMAVGRQITALGENHRLTFGAVSDQINGLGVALLIKAAAINGAASQREDAEASALITRYGTEDFSGVGISSGLDDLDRAINGFEKGRVCVFGADSGVGKSIFLQTVSRNMAKRGTRGAIISFELPVQEYIQRAASAESGIDLNLIKQHTMTQDQTRRFYESLKRMAAAKTPLHYVYMERPTLGQLKARILELYYAHGLDFVGIDYLDTRWFTPTEKAHKGDSLAFLGDISATLNSLAKELNIFFINLVQTNRAAQTRGGAPTLRDFAGGAPVERDAGVAGILQDVDDIAAADYGAVYLHILKSRTSAKQQIVKLKARKEIFTFSTWEGE